MQSIIISCLAIVLFFWGAFRVVDDRLREKERIRGRQRASFSEAFSSTYILDSSSSREETFFYILQGTFFFFWLIFSTLSWGILEPGSALIVTVGMLFLTFGVPRAWKVRKQRGLVSRLESQMPIATFLFVLATNKSESLIPTLDLLGDSTKLSRMEPSLNKTINRCEMRLRYGMRPQKAFSHFSSELKIPSASGLADAIVRNLSDLQEGLMNLKLFSREQEVAYQAEKELRSNIYFLLGSVLLAAVMLTSFVIIFI